MKALGRKQNVSFHFEEYVGDYSYVAAHKQSGDNVVYPVMMLLMIPGKHFHLFWIPTIRSTAYVLLMITFMQSANLNHFRDIVWLKTIGKVELI